MNNYQPHRLRKLLINIQRCGYRFVSLDEFIKSGGEAGDVAITFDDGFEMIYMQVYPILAELGIPAAIFIPAGFIGKPASWDYSAVFRTLRHLNREQLAEMSRNNIIIGSHGMTHTDLTGISDRLIRLELKQSKEELERIIGTKVRYISYPFGRFDERIESLALETGYERGFSMSFFKKSRYGFSLPRHAVYAIDTTYSVLNKFGGGFLGGIEKVKGAVMNSYSSGTILLNRFRFSDLTREH
nr:polysaccharide deacetylase family protein [candidate division Zixibacteria bacterium]